MNNGSQGGLALKLNARAAIWSSIEELQEQFNASTSNKDRTKINGDIQELMAQLSTLRALSLQTLNDSHEVMQAVADIQGVTKELNVEAANVKTVADALNKGAGMVEKATNIVTKIAGVAAIV